MEKKEKPKLKMFSVEGVTVDAFTLLGLARKAAEEADWPQEAIDEFLHQATSGNYDHLLQTCMKYFNVF